MPAGSQPTISSEARTRLLDAVIDQVSAEGIGDLSLRPLAEAIGSSHRMLIYHFGSKEGLLVEVVRTVEARQRQLLDDLVASASLAAPGPGAPDRDEVARVLGRWWDRLADPAMWPLERLFFELYGQALQGRPGVAPFLDDIVESWLVPATALGRQLGLDEATARDQARLGLAVTRGLLLDLLATGDRAGVDRAMARYIEGVVGSLVRGARRGGWRTSASSTPTSPVAG